MEKAFLTQLSPSGHQRNAISNNVSMFCLVVYLFVL